MYLIIFTLTPFVLMLTAFFFKQRQNTKKQVGGDISTPKSLWLSYTIGSWFVLPIVLLFMEIGHGLEVVIIFHLISFWTRGILELVMIYKWFNWSPLHGISHDLFHFVGLIVLINIYWPAEMFRSSLLALFYIGSLIISIGFETLFAILFLKVRGHEKNKVYFASDSEEWKTVNRITWVVVFICYGLHFLNIFVVYELGL